MSAPIQEKVRILEKEYVVACKSDERDALHESARLLDKKMREIRDSGKIIGTERITVMAALNIAYELLKEKSVERGRNEALDNRLRIMRQRIEAELDQDDRHLKL